MLRAIDVLGLTAAAAAGAAYEHTMSRERTFLDPVGNPYTQAVRASERPYLVPGAVTAAAVWVAAAIEARLHAGRATARAATPGSLGALRVRVAPALGAAGAPGVRLHASF